jgi:hypothetical protein
LGLRGEFQVGSIFFNVLYHFKIVVFHTNNIPIENY